jgi:hypothetical protein
MSDQGQQQQQQSAPPAGTLAADPAFATFDAETQGAFKNHGWDAKSPAEAAREALKSFREAEKFVGIPKDQLVRLPKDATDAEGVKAFRTRIGVPEDAKGYDFSGVKFSDGTALDEDFVSSIGSAFHSEGVPKDAAPNIARAIVKFIDDADKNSATVSQAKAAEDADTLRKSWGHHMEANTFIANQAAEKLGLDKDILQTLVGAEGRTKVANALLKIGQMMGEDKFVSPQNREVPGVMNREQAEARFQELKADTGWVSKVNAGDTKAVAELDALNRIRAGV